MFRFFVSSLLALALGAPALFAQDLQPLPAPGRVVDLTGTLRPDYQQDLERRILELEKEKGAQLAVVIVPTTQPEAIEAYSLRLAETWGVGRKGYDDGVLLVVAKNDRQLRIEVGYGLEGAIPDARANRIIDQLIVPEFRAGNFQGGIEDGFQALAAAVRGEESESESTAIMLEEAERDLAAKYERREKYDFNFWSDFSYIWLAPCALVGLLLLWRKYYWAGFLVPSLLYAALILFLYFLFRDDYFLPALFVIPLYAFLYTMLWTIRSGNISSGSSGSSGYTGSGYRSSYTSSSSSSYSGSSYSGSSSFGGGSFGGGGASGSW